MNPYSTTVVPAPEILKRDVECFRIFKYTGKEQISIKVSPIAQPGIVFQQKAGQSALELPTTDKKVSLKPTSFIYGPRTELGTMYYREGPWSAVQVILEPHALQSLLGINSTSLINGAMELDQFAGNNINIQLIQAKNEVEQVDILTNFLLDQGRQERVRDEMIEDILQLIHNKIGTITKKFLLKQAKISERQFENRFIQTVGVSPHLYIRIKRFNEAIKLMKTGKFERLTDVAHALNFYDQSHFIRDLKEFSGITPKSIFQRVNNFQEQGGFSYI
jgi:AraC-like DNA-binding protein